MENYSITLVLVLDHQHEHANLSISYRHISYKANIFAQNCMLHVQIASQALPSQTHRQFPLSDKGYVVSSHLYHFLKPTIQQ